MWAIEDHADGAFEIIEFRPTRYSQLRLVVAVGDDPYARERAALLVDAANRASGHLGTSHLDTLPGDTLPP